MKNPNKDLWQNYDAYAELRGELVALLLSQYVPLKDTRILDVGCGTGGIAVTLARQGAKVTAIEINRPKRQQFRENILEKKVHIDVKKNMSDAGSAFDAVLLVDVIEHVLRPEKVLQTCYEKLKPNGMLYMTTPNKLSPLNMICDPHFSLPLVSVLNRQSVKKLISSYLGWQPENRVDFPELFSFRQLSGLLNGYGFSWYFVNRQVVELAVESPHRLWNRSLHIKMINFLKRSGLLSLLKASVSNKKAGFNKWFNPTWFIMAHKSTKPD